jgi:hypothetical protein
MAQKRSRSFVLENIDMKGRHDIAYNCIVLDPHITLNGLYGKMSKKQEDSLVEHDIINKTKYETRIIMERTGIETVKTQQAII